MEAVKLILSTKLEKLEANPQREITYEIEIPSRFNIKAHKPAYYTSRSVKPIFEYDHESVDRPKVVNLYCTDYNAKFRVVGKFNNGLLTVSIKPRRIKVETPIFTYHVTKLYQRTAYMISNCEIVIKSFDLNDPNLKTQNVIKFDVISSIGSYDRYQFIVKNLEHIEEEIKNQDFYAKLTRCDNFDDCLDSIRSNRSSITTCNGLAYNFTT